MGHTQAQNFAWLGLAFCVALAACATTVASKRTNQCTGFEFSPLQWLLTLGCLAWLTAVAVAAGQENNPRVAWYGFWQCIALASCYFSAQAVLANRHGRSAAILIVLMGCAATAVQGIYQVTIDFPANRAEYQADPDKYLAQGELDAPAGSPLRKRFEDRLNSPEPLATYALANSLAVTLSAGLVLCVGMALTSLAANATGGASNHPLCRAAIVALATTLLITWFLTRSRTAYLAVLIAVGIWALLAMAARRQRQQSLPWKRISLVVSGLGVIVVIGIAWLAANDRLVLSEAAKSFAFRLEYWQATVDMIAEHSLFGVGLGNFQAYYPRYMLATASETVADPHNWFLDLAATLSLPLAVVIAIWLCRRVGVALQAKIPEMGDTPLPRDESRATTESPFAEDPTRPSPEVAAGTSSSMLVGAGVGGLLCWLGLEFLSVFDGSGALLGWIVAVPLGYAIWPAVVRLAGEPNRVWGVAVLAMLLCLLASGSWQAPGIAVPLLVLLSAGASLKPAYRGKRRWQEALAPVFLAGMGLLCFVFQSWMPTTRSWALMEQAGLARSLNEQQQIARAAMDADPLDTLPVQFMAQLLVAEALQSPPELLGRRGDSAVSALEDWLARDNVKSLNWQLAGDRTLELASRADASSSNSSEKGKRLFLSKSAEFYAAAVKRQPTSVQLHVQRAAVLALLGEKSSAIEQLDQAQKLSDQTPHVDKKLETQQIWLPPFEVASVESSGDSFFVPAEPVAEWIRSL
ncbi:MAG: O-antigen ligase family protein [Pirellulaceae bacterium]